jgi:predicted MFS family arabinose efflux permease
LKGVRGWTLVAVLTASETVSWGVLYYAFAVLMVPMSRDLGWSIAELTAAFSLALMTSALAGIPVGRWLDRRPPRRLMTAGSVLGAAMMVGWSRVESLLAFYLVWVGIGVAMAIVLYQPAFTVLSKWFPSRRRQALTVLTLVAATASFIFSPLANHLVESGGWRHAAFVLGIALAVLTVPLHAVLPDRERPPRGRNGGAGSVSGRVTLRSRGFWLFTAAFCLEMIATTAATVLFIPAVLERGHPASFAAFVAGVIGLSALPGRLVFASVSVRRPQRQVLVGIFGTTALSIAMLLAAEARATIIASAVALGASNGMATLAFATGLGDRFGTASYGIIGAVSSFFLTMARAAAPVTAGLLAAYSLDAALWTAAAAGGAAAGVGLLAGGEPDSVGARRVDHATEPLGS